MTRSSSQNPPGGSRGGLQVATPVPSGLIGRYQILDKIGEGGMGSLFLARDPAIDRLVAIKLLRHGLDTEALRERFAREARAAGRLRHRHIVTIFDVGEHDGDPFIAMEFLAGETLAELIRDGARLSLSRRLTLLEELCDGLAYAHRSGLVHRDIKPANLMVDADGVLKILDFGIVRVTDSGMTQAGVLVGTVNYMSPEQVVGAAVDHRSDIFAVGLVAYELISGRQAFPGTMKDGLLNKIINVGAEPLAVVVAGLDPEVAAIVEQAMQKDPADRYQDLVRMRNDLARACVRIERDEERAAADAAAGAGETAVISEHATLAMDTPRASSPAIVQDAERALAVGNFRAALTLAGRSAAINPQDRAASGIAARAEAALLDRGRQLQSGAPASGVPAAPIGTASPAPSSGAGRALWIAGIVAVLAIGVASAAWWLRNPAPPASVAVTQKPEPAPPAPAGSETPPAPSGTAAEAGAGPGTLPPPVSPPTPDPASGNPAVSAVQPVRPSAPETVQRGAAPPARSAAARGGSSRGQRAEPERRPAPVPSALPPPPSPASAGPPAPPAAPARPALPLRVGVDASAPRLTRHVPPTYPPEAQAAGVEGTVQLELTIGPDGHVSDARVVRSVKGLDEAAQAAAKQWEFAPTLRNGEAVSLIYPIGVSFDLPEPARPPAAPPPAAPKPTAPATPAPAPPTKPAETGRAAGPPTPDSREEIEGALRRYKAAWEALDAAALERVQSLSAAEAVDVRRFMASANRYQLEMSVQSVTVEPSGRSAVARVAMTRRFSPKIGRAPAPQSSTNNVHLEKRGDAWVITGIQ